MKIKSYQSYIFDCDGVILDSNDVKTKAFYQVALPYGAEFASQLVNYHKRHGGISRYRKFQFFVEQILPLGHNKPTPDILIKKYADLVVSGLLNCRLSDDLDIFRRMTSGAKWFIVSGGDEDELRHVFHMRGLEGLFNGGIFGSPEPKNRILSREISSGKMVQPAIFFGDSQYDHQVSKEAGIDFVFVSEWSDFSDWKAYCRNEQVPTIRTLKEWLLSQ